MEHVVLLLSSSILESRNGSLERGQRSLCTSTTPEAEKTIGDVVKSKFVELSKSIVASSYYCGPSFSAADFELDLIARGKAIPAGSVGTNRWIDVNHHLSFVADEVDKLDEAPVRSATRQGVV